MTMLVMIKKKNSVQSQPFFFFQNTSNNQTYFFFLVVVVCLFVCVLYAGDAPNQTFSYDSKLIRLNGTNSCIGFVMFFALARKTHFHLVCAIYHFLPSSLELTAYVCTHTHTHTHTHTPVLQSGRHCVALCGLAKRRCWSLRCERPPFSMELWHQQACVCQRGNGLYKSFLKERIALFESFIVQEF